MRKKERERESRGEISREKGGARIYMTQGVR